MSGNQSSGKAVHDDSHSDYQEIKAQAAKAMRRGVWVDRFEPRFVPFGQRRMDCELPRQAIDCLSQGKHFSSYRGLPMAKDPLDMTLYSTLFFEVQPRTIIELGAYTGASAWWMSDLLRTFQIEARVYSVDIDLSLVDEQVRRDPAVQFMEGDCQHIDQIFPAGMLRQLKHPLLLIDDAHVNIAGVYQHFHEHALQPGDYLIVEDTIPWIPGSFGKPEHSAEWGDWKWQEIQHFFGRHEASYRVDRYYTDFFGYNGTWNWNGFVKRV